MTRLRTGNNRRRAKELKQGGLYSLRRAPPVPLRWTDSGKPVSIDQIRELLE